MKGNIKNISISYKIGVSTNNQLAFRCTYRVWHFIGQKFPALRQTGNDFEYLPQVSPSSQLFNRSLNGWLESLSTEDRERAVDALFSVLRSSHADSISDLMAAGLKAVPTMINTFVGLSEADRRHLIEAMGLLMAAVRSRSSR